MTILVIEPFYGGSHKQMIELLCRHDNTSSADSYVVYTLPAKKCHWRARCSALYFAQTIPHDTTYTLVPQLITAIHCVMRKLCSHSVQENADSIHCVMCNCVAIRCKRMLTCKALLLQVVCCA